MAKVTNKQIAAAFRRARVLIEDRREYFICCAIAGSVEKGTQTAHNKAESIIATRLGGRFKTAEYWLWNNHSGYAKWSESVSADERCNQMRLYRLRWLDALIEEFEKKE